MWSAATGGGDTRGRGVGAWPAEFRLEVTSCDSGSAWRKYPVPRRGLPLTCSPVPGVVIAQESVCQLVMWLMPCARVPGAPRAGGTQCSSPAYRDLACLLQLLFVGCTTSLWVQGSSRTPRGDRARETPPVRGSRCRAEDLGYEAGWASLHPPCCPGTSG